jgi:arginine decarboxylase
MNNKNRRTIRSEWGVDNSAELYGVPYWGGDYFSASERGTLEVCLNSETGKQTVDLLQIVEGVKERGFDMPVLLRFENFLDSQITLLNRSFNEAIARLEYQGGYRGVYPIKVNQQQQVVEEVARFGKRYHHGLEAGSKAELIAALAMINDPEACIICNGYKDEEFIDLGLNGIKLGYKIFFVIEMMSELPLILERSRAMGVEPNIGVRSKLNTKAGGQWTESGGSRSVFGLSTRELIDVVDVLREENALHYLKLLHYHLGSQIPNIRDIQKGVAEASFIYAGLALEGAPMGFIDFGGGLAVDYDGSKSNCAGSCNYTIDEYCSDIIEILMQKLDEKGVSHPTIITESGRATVAYYSILLFNVLDVSRFETAEIPNELPESYHEMTKNLWETGQSLSPRTLQESYHDALFYLDELLLLFHNGAISLREKSVAEGIFWNIVQAISDMVKDMKRIPPDLASLEEAIRDIYYCNFSLFQSLPDSWAIDQLFPIMPIHRLDEKPTRKGIISDITCDSDGKIAQFIDHHGVRKALPLHELRQNEEYYLGVFMVGAYQETLGDLHNLMGDTNVVSIRINGDGSYDFTRELEGDSVSDVLSYVEYDPKNLLKLFRDTAEQAVKDGKINVQERRKIMDAFETGLRGYTYYER